VPGYLFSPANTALVMLFGNAGLRSLRIGSALPGPDGPPAEEAPSR
jgi:hypothetical protein